MMMMSKGRGGRGRQEGGEKFKRVGVLWTPRSGKQCRSFVEENLCGCLVGEGSSDTRLFGVKGQKSDGCFWDLEPKLCCSQ